MKVLTPAAILVIAPTPCYFISPTNICNPVTADDLGTVVEIGVADFDGNGVSDLIIASSNGSLWYYKVRNRKGKERGRNLHAERDLGVSLSLSLLSLSPSLCSSSVSSLCFISSPLSQFSVLSPSLPLSSSFDQPHFLLVHRVAAASPLRSTRH
jgi:hypothetical protein